MPHTKEDNVLIISCDDDHDACKQAIASGIPVYSAELLLTGILRQELFLDKYPFEFDIYCLYICII